MKKLPSVLALACFAALAGAEPASHPVAITLGYDDDAGVCTVAMVEPMAVDVDPGDKVVWTATDGSGRCAGRTVTLAGFKLKGTDRAKDPVPGCNKSITAGGDPTRCTVSNANRGETFKYDVELPGGRGMDPEIRVRN